MINHRNYIRDHNIIAKERLENQEAGERLVQNLSYDYSSNDRWRGMVAQAIQQTRMQVGESYELPQEGLENYYPNMPTPHNSVLLAGLKKLRELGALSDELGRGRLPDVSCWYDYYQHGWPLDEGPSKRYVTPEEHREIVRRLKGQGLTLAGSEVPVVTATLADLLARDIKQPGWLVEGLMREGGAVMLYAPTGLGKTWFATTLALLAAHGKGLEAVASGETNTEQHEQPALLKAGPGKGVRVLVIDGEMTEADLQIRARMLLTSMGKEDHGTEEIEGIIYATKTAQDHRANFVDLSRPEWLMKIVEYVTEKEVGLVVFDNLSTLNPSLEDENSAAAWAPLNEMVVALKHKGVAVMAVHHTGKGAAKGQAYRGSSNLLTTMETAISLERVDGELEPLGGDAKFRVVLEKHRSHGTPKLHGKVLRLTGFGWQVEVDEFALTERVVALARSLKFTRQWEIAKALDLEPYQVSRVLKKAFAHNLTNEAEFAGWLVKAKDLRDNPMGPLEVNLDI